MKHPGNWLIEKHVLFFYVPRFVFATLPAMPPVAYQELEAEGVDFHARLEAYAEVAEIHLVLVRVRKKQAQVTCDSEKEVVIEWRQVGELLDKELRNLLSARAFASNSFLSRFREKFVGKFA